MSGYTLKSGRLDAIITGKCDGCVRRMGPDKLRWFEARTRVARFSAIVCSEQCRKVAELRLGRAYDDPIAHLLYCEGLYDKSGNRVCSAPVEWHPEANDSRSQWDISVYSTGTDSYSVQEMNRRGDNRSTSVVWSIVDDMEDSSERPSAAIVQERSH